MNNSTRSKWNQESKNETQNGNNISQTNSLIELDFVKKKKKKVNPKTADQGSSSNNNNLVLNEDSNLSNLTQLMFVKGIKKGQAVVDPLFMNSSDYHVIADTSDLFNGRCFDCTLNKSNLKNNNNKFYIIQLLALDKKPNQFALWTRWGRVGYEGQSSLKDYNNLENAIRDFLKKYYDKLRAGYFQLIIDYSNDTLENKPVNQNESSLPKSVQNLLQLIYNINIMNQQMAEIGYDSKKMPLGKLGKETLLQEIVLKSVNHSSKELNDLSSKFYSLIPHDFGFNKMQSFIIKDLDFLKKKVDLIESLSDIQIATKILDDTKDTNDIIDQYYRKLECNIEPLMTNSREYEIIQGFLNNTGGLNVDIVDAFIVKRSVEEEQFLDKGNKMLLWHGSRISNYVGILSKGLRIASPEAPSSGYKFGKGLYFSDMASMSLSYCYPNNKIGCVLLCEVSLGNYNELFTLDFNASNLPEGKHSTKGCGQTAPHVSSYIELDGVKIPTGKGEKTGVKSFFGYNEYVVYDVRQVKIRYLLKLKWK